MTDYLYPYKDHDEKDQLVIDVFMKATPKKIGAGMQGYVDVCGGHHFLPFDNTRIGCN